MRVTTFQVDPSVNEEMWASRFIQFVHFIKLETSDKCLLGVVQKIELNNGDLFIKDDQNKVFRFDVNGKFLNTIGQKGKGPGEFLGVRDFSVFGNSVWVYHRQVLHEYDLEGNFIRSINLRKSKKLAYSSTRNIEATKDGIYLYNGYLEEWVEHSNQWVYLLDVEGDKFRIKDIGIPHNPEIDYGIMMEQEHHFSRHGENTLFFGFYKDTVYHMKDQEVLHKYAFDFGAYALSYKERKELQKKQTLLIDVHDKAQGVYKSFLTKKGLLTDVFFNSHDVWHYVDFETGEELTFTSIKDDVMAYDFGTCYSSEGKLVTVIPTVPLLGFKGKISSETFLGKIIEVTKPYDNPTIAVCTLR